MNYSSICLLCLEEQENLLKINGKLGIDLNIGAILQQHFWFEITTSEENICRECWEKVETFHIFYNSVKSTHQELSSREIERNHQVEYIDVKIKHEPDLDITDALDKSYHIHDAIDPTATTLIENQVTRESKSRRYSKTDVHTATLSKYFKMECDLCDVPMPSFLEIKRHFKDVHQVNSGYLICCNRKFYLFTSMLQHCQWHENPEIFKCNQCHRSYKSEKLLRTHRCHARSCRKRGPRRLKKEYEMIRSRFSMLCDLCSEPFITLRKARQHYSKAHNQEGYLRCCDEKFFQMVEAIEHCMWHDDVDSLKCSICQKYFSDKVSRRDHIKKIHTPQDDDEREFQCYICKVTFARVKLLKGHLRVNHGKEIERELKCDTPRDGERNTNVNSHICEVCAKSFKTRDTYRIHYLTVHSGDLQKVQCDICGVWSKNKFNIRKHMQQHDSKTEKCRLCGRICKNMFRLRCHLRSAHRAPSLKCVVCSKMMKSKLTLKEHMAIHAGIKDLYSCKFCSKTFRSRANMHSHRKKVHLAEYEQEKAGKL